MGGFQHVVEHAGGDADDFGKAVEIEISLFGERVLDEAGQVDRTQAAAAVGRQRLFGAGVGRLDHFAVIEVVVLVHAVEEQNARFGVVVGGFHHLIPQIAGAHLAVNPYAVFALIGARFEHVGIGIGPVYELDKAVGINRFHEGIADADGNVEIAQVAFVFGVDEFFDIRMVAAQYAHLGAAAGAGGFNGFAGAVENTHVGNRAGGAGVRAFDERALRPDAGEVITDTATAAHGFGGFGQGGVDARLAIGGFDDGVADRLHEAVDQRGVEVGTGGGVDAASRDETVFLGPQEAIFPMSPILFLFDLG